MPYYGFANGNKRTAFVAGAIFLERHGTMLAAPEEEVTDFRPAPVDNRISEDDLTVWLQKHLN